MQISKWQVSQDSECYYPKNGLAAPTTRVPVASGSCRQPLRQPRHGEVVVTTLRLPHGAQPPKMASLREATQPLTHPQSGFGGNLAKMQRIRKTTQAALRPNGQGQPRRCCSEHEHPQERTHLIVFLKNWPRPNSTAAAPTSQRWALGSAAESCKPSSQSVNLSIMTLGLDFADTRWLKVCSW